MNVNCTKHTTLQQSYMILKRIVKSLSRDLVFFAPSFHFWSKILLLSCCALRNTQRLRYWKNNYFLSPKYLGRHIFFKNHILKLLILLFEIWFIIYFPIGDHSFFFNSGSKSRSWYKYKIAFFFFGSESERARGNYSRLILELSCITCCTLIGVDDLRDLEV